MTNLASDNLIAEPLPGREKRTLRVAFTDDTNGGAVRSGAPVFLYHPLSFAATRQWKELLESGEDDALATLAGRIIGGALVNVEVDGQALDCTGADLLARLDVNETGTLAALIAAGVHLIEPKPNKTDAEEPEKATAPADG